ncbi:MAG: hypothetical protein HY842_06075 [Bacteroidetes bacterium]|nr:hypothetical protein [Bacteroidota bacterium]
MILVKKREAPFPADSIAGANLRQAGVAGLSELSQRLSKWSPGVLFAHASF